MIKDRILKLKLLKYFLGRFWYSQLEVDILAKERISQSRKIVTDIDVLAIYPDIIGNFNMVLGDCKTLKSQSPISRALWMKGLMVYMNASKGFIILQKDIEKDHQLTSAILDIQLLSETDFDVYARHNVNQSLSFNSALADMDNWDILFDVPNKFPALRSLHEYSKSDFWNEPESSNRLRHSLLALKKVRKEINPTNKLHLAIVLNHISLVAVAVNDIIIKIFNRYLLPDTKQELDDDLKVLIWGGIENYNYLNDLRKKFSGQTGVENDLSLPRWNHFLEFIRSWVENPLAFNFVPLFIKENGFAFLSENKLFDYAEIIAAKNPFIVSYAIKITEYVVQSCDMQNELVNIFSNKFLKLDHQTSI
jgi:hypothetical protein